MRFADEYRDPELAEMLGRQISALCEPGRHYKLMEVCGGHTHTIYRYGVQDHLPESIELVHGPGCPVCVIPMGRVDDGIAIARARGRDPHLFRRHDAGARRSRFVPGGQRPGRRHPHGVLPARRVAHRPPESRQAGRLLRDRLRDDSTVDGPHDPAGRRRGHRKLLGVLQPRHDHPGYQGDSRLARSAARRLHRSGSRLDRHRLPPV